MIEFKLPDMTCGHCARRVTEAIKAVDAAGQVTVDLPAKTVQIESHTERSVLVAALAQAGYPPA
jgi:copper chaperone